MELAYDCSHSARPKIRMAVFLTPRAYNGRRTLCPRLAKNSWPNASARLARNICCVSGMTCRRMSKLPSPGRSRGSISPKSRNWFSRLCAASQSRPALSCGPLDRAQPPPAIRLSEQCAGPVYTVSRRKRTARAGIARREAGRGPGRGVGKERGWASIIRKACFPSDRFRKHRCFEILFEKLLAARKRYGAAIRCTS